jgi:uncharacterized protein YdeI (BOF family)
MKSLILAAAFAAVLPLAVADAAGPFDGNYTGGSPPAGGRNGCAATIATVSIANGKITGKYTERNYTFNITGTVAADGTVTGRWSSNPFTGKFSGGHFAGSYNSKECKADRPIELNKAG